MHRRPVVFVALALAVSVACRATDFSSPPSGYGWTWDHGLRVERTMGFELRGPSGELVETGKLYVEGHDRGAWVVSLMMGMPTLLLFAIGADTGSVGADVLYKGGMTALTCATILLNLRQHFRYRSVPLFAIGDGSRECPPAPLSYSARTVIPYQGVRPAFPEPILALPSIASAVLGRAIVRREVSVRHPVTGEREKASRLDHLDLIIDRQFVNEWGETVYVLQDVEMYGRWGSEGEDSSRSLSTLLGLEDLTSFVDDASQTNELRDRFKEAGVSRDTL